MLSALAFVSQTEFLRVNTFDSNFFYYFRRPYEASITIDTDVLTIS